MNKLITRKQFLSLAALGGTSVMLLQPAGLTGQSAPAKKPKGDPLPSNWSRNG
ncbi:MAG: hypothetical protein IPK76_00430 [Lewinellaceae bacterium]|nr:hypothetical protein [Lewinellaceae bacterium]